MHTAPLDQGINNERQAALRITDHRKKIFPKAVILHMGQDLIHNM